MATGSLDPWTLLVLMLALLIVLGCFMESLAMILVVGPFFWPVLLDLNGGDLVSAANAVYDMNAASLKIWNGILALIVVELGLIKPPVGLNVFIISAISREVSMDPTFIGMIPFFAAEILRVALILSLPLLALGLPA